MSCTLNPLPITGRMARLACLAAAHEAAAKCLESGKGHDQCQKDLQAACRNLAIGKYCGMKHAH